MGGEFWEYYTPFTGDVETTLDNLRRQEFQAGRYDGSHLRPATIEQAIANADADGTRSILDMERVAPSPETGAVSPIPLGLLKEIFGTDRPTRTMVEEALRGEGSEAIDDVIEEIERGEGRYILLFDGDRVTEVYFCGYSYD